MDSADGEHSVVQDPVYKYYRLDPIPSSAAMDRFYESRYYELIRRGGRACDLGRLMAGGDVAEQERQWLRETLYTDIVHVIRENAPGRRLLDIGCGAGEFVAYAKDNGFDCTGIEPSQEVAEAGRARDLAVHCANLEEFTTSKENNKAFDVVVMLNVLEHVPDPVKVTKLVRKATKPGGVVCVRVPNDFSEIQLAAQRKLNAKPWWIAVPDHINYFNFASLQHFLGQMGFDVFYSQGDFPMELFLLMGEEYVGNSEVGGRCHQKRKSYEMSIPGDLRRNIYQGMARIGLGRDCLVFSRVR